MPTILIAVGDEHANSKVGLCPPIITLDNAGSYLPSKSQLWLYGKWKKFWRIVAKLKEQLKCEVWVVNTGDLADINVHSSSILVSTNRNDAVQMGVAIWEPVKDIADELFIIRGTEAHVGEQGWVEEEIAKQLGANQDFALSQDLEKAPASWWHLPLFVEKVLFSLAHHPKTSGWRPWTEQAAAGRESSIHLSKSAAARLRVPDIVVRGHVHHARDSGLASWPRTFGVPSWTLTGPYGYRKGAGWTPTAIGGLVFVVDGADYTAKFHKWSPKRREPWRKLAKPKS